MELGGGHCEGQADGVPLVEREGVLQVYGGISGCRGSVGIAVFVDEYVVFADFIGLDELPLGIGVTAGLHAFEGEQGEFAVVEQVLVGVGFAATSGESVDSALAFYFLKTPLVVLCLTVGLHTGVEGAAQTLSGSGQPVVTGVIGV